MYLIEQGRPRRHCRWSIALSLGSEIRSESELSTKVWGLIETLIVNVSTCPSALRRYYLRGQRPCSSTSHASMFDVCIVLDLDTLSLFVKQLSLRMAGTLDQRKDELLDSDESRFTCGVASVTPWRVGAIRVDCWRWWFWGLYLSSSERSFCYLSLRGGTVNGTTVILLSAIACPYRLLLPFHDRIIIGVITEYKDRAQAHSRWMLLSSR